MVETIGARVLVVDDEVAIRDLLDYGLGQAGFSVRSVGDGRTALDAVRQWSPEVIVLDVMLPEIDGFTLLPALRRITDVPIVMLSARTETAEKVAGLSRGADDYVSKPFELEELIARLHSALRRPRMELRQTFAYGDLTVDVGRRSVFRGNRRVELSTREFDLLVTLVRNPEHVFTRSQLLDLVWGVTATSCRTRSKRTSPICGRRSTAVKRSSSSTRCAASATHSARRRPRERKLRAPAADRHGARDRGGAGSARGGGRPVHFRLLHQHRAGRRELDLQSADGRARILAR